jgi:hypothetical protein
MELLDDKANFQIYFILLKIDSFQKKYEFARISFQFQSLIFARDFTLVVIDF